MAAWEGAVSNDRCRFPRALGLNRGPERGNSGAERMTYAVLQTELAIPPVEKLKRAFRSVKFLTELDAHTLANDAFGILVKRLSFEQASALKGALLTEGIETEVVEEPRLPTLAQTKFVHRLECSPDGLLVYDPLNRSFTLEWKHIILIAAGRVRLTEFKQVRKTRYQTRYDFQGNPHQEEIVERSSKEERNFHLLLELILTRGVQRFSATADKFDFRYLGDRLTRDATGNFTMLVQDLVKFAPHAAINQGAYYLRENAPDPFSYPSKNAFFEEITWLLWRVSQAAAP